jgi:RNA polymerase sigma-70 factor (ECF subfamily)
MVAGSALHRTAPILRRVEHEMCETQSASLALDFAVNGRMRLDRPMDDADGSTRAEPDDDDRRLAGLMHSAQEGDGEAYAALLSEAARLARKNIRNRMRDLPSQDIEDLVQDVLLSLHRARATFNPNRPFLPWLMAIARHRIADGARRHARRRREVVIENAGEAHADDALGGSMPMHSDAPALARAMASLPHRQRQAIELVKLREMSLQEAATVTGTSTGAIKVAVHRGIGALRKALGGKD